MEAAMKSALFPSHVSVEPRVWPECQCAAQGLGWDIQGLHKPPQMQAPSTVSGESLRSRPWSRCSWELWHWMPAQVEKTVSVVGMGLGSARRILWSAAHRGRRYSFSPAY